ncbi:hypothetical protein JIW86_01330 [Streptomyces sp. NBC_00162]|nr:hypothetical protein [Streptomyces sp. NBC_00162]UUU37674.1 hypothetical protein JIW86_01330 [Streptomyces sp. NBC_00162]
MAGTGVSVERGEQPHRLRAGVGLTAFQWRVGISPRSFGTGCHGPIAQYETGVADLEGSVGHVEGPVAEDEQVARAAHAWAEDPCGGCPSWSAAVDRDHVFQDEVVRRQAGEVLDEDGRVG